MSAFRGQPTTEDWVQADGTELIGAPIQDDGTVKITRDAFAVLMQRAGFVRIGVAPKVKP